VNSKQTINTKPTSFFDKNYQTPEFITTNIKKTVQNRRHFLKAAAGMGALTSLPSFNVTAKTQASLTNLLSTLLKKDPWLTLNSTLNHLLPSSPTGPSAIDIKAIDYLYQVMTVQPTELEEKDFILKGVGWLNGYAQSEKSADFSHLIFSDKEELLRGISQSKAGQNWLNTLLGYIFQAMLSPPSYGGNPQGIGWQWLDHQAGFPLPEKGQRYFELPTRARISLISHVSYRNMSQQEGSHKKSPQGTRKA